MGKYPPLPDRKEWVKEFIKSETAIRIKEDVNNWQQNRPFLFSIDNMAEFDNVPDLFAGKFRRIYVDKSIKLVTFYYIDYIAKNTEGPIYEFGCGDNIYSKFYPIIGVDPMNVRAHIRDFFDEDYAKDHQKQYNAAIAICSLHYIPITKIRQQIELFASMIKDGGLGYVSLNLNRLLNNTSDEIRIELGFENLDLAWDYVRNEIDKMNVNVIHREFFDTILDEGADGNIRILFETGAR